MTIFVSKLRIQCKEKKPTFLDFTTKKNKQFNNSSKIFQRYKTIQIAKAAVIFDLK